MDLTWFQAEIRWYKERVEMAKLSTQIFRNVENSDIQRSFPTMIAIPEHHLFCLNWTDQETQIWLKSDGQDSRTSSFR